MLRLKTGYLISGIITGCILVLTFLGTMPDGKLHVVFCAVGQGDGIYVRFPDGRDMTIDGGPTDAGMIACLSRHMPFWDRVIDIAVLTHPQKDHMNGLVEVLSRYRVSYLVRSNVSNSTDGFAALMRMVSEKNIEEKLVTTGQTIDVGSVVLRIVWPTQQQIASMHTGYSLKQSPVSPARLASERAGGVERTEGAVLGSFTVGDVNDASVVFKLSYGTFDVLFTGDADSRVDAGLIQELSDDPDGLDVLKVPHHGAKTGMTDAFLSRLFPAAGAIAAISVGKNSYGHPAQETIEKLQTQGFTVLRTDTDGDIEIVSDGNGWEVRK